MEVSYSFADAFGHKTGASFVAMEAGQAQVVVKMTSVAYAAWLVAQVVLPMLTLAGHHCLIFVTRQARDDAKTILQVLHYHFGFAPDQVERDEPPVNQAPLQLRSLEQNAAFDLRRGIHPLWQGAVAVCREKHPQLACSLF